MRKSPLLAIGHAWDAVHISHKGAFSAERLQRLHAFILWDKTTCRSSWLRTAAVTLLTPLPCLLLVLLSEALPLASPLAGPKANGAFWIRVWLVQGCYTYAFFMLVLYCNPELPQRFRLLVPISAAISAAHTAVHFGIASTLGFPVPFSTILLATPWFIFIVVALWIYIGPACRSNLLVRLKLKRFTVMIYAGSSLSIVYPLFYYGFLMAKKYPFVQVLLTVLVLPMIKILEKLLLYQVTYHLPDTQPVYIAFNVEIFNGLFTASCMRNTISTMVTVVLMIVDFLSCTAALYGLQNRFIRVDEMNIKVGPEFTRATMIEVALLILSDESCSAFTTDVMEPLKIKRFSATIVPLSLLSSVESWGYRKPVSGRRTFKNIVLETVPPVAAPPPRLKKKVSTNSAVERPKSAVSWSQSRGHFLENKLHASTILKALSVDERQRFVLETCRVLRRVESLLIVEYIEVMVPVLYAIYLAAIYHLPNRAYFSNVRDLSETELATTIQSVMIYGILQLLSLILLISQLSRRFQLEPWVQLHFVLRNAYAIVQSTLTLWVMYVLQTSLEHVGTDYTFRFAWLDKNKTK